MKHSAPSVTRSRSTTTAAKPSGRSATPSCRPSEGISYAVQPVPWTPHAGQRRGVKFLLEHAAAGLFADPGVGKTTIVLGAFKVLKAKKLATRMLVVAPLRVAHMVWPAEIMKWADFHGLRVEVLHGPRKDEALARDADVYVINYEGLDWLLGATRTRGANGRVAVTADVKAFKAHRFDTLVIDELSKVKNIQSGRHKALKAVAGTFGRRWGLTGSPSANGLLDLFGECYMLDLGRSLGPYITHYRSKYFVPAFNGFDWHLRKGAEAEIYERIRPLVLRLDADDFIDMPRLVTNELRFDLPPDIRRVYDALEDDMIAKLSTGETVRAANAGAAAMKCRQVANGGLYLDPSIEELLRAAGIGRNLKRDWTTLHDLKTDLVEELVEELQGSPLLVAYDFNHDLDRLRRRFGKDVPYIGGGVSTKRAKELEAAWNRGELPILLGHPASMGHGLNLQGAGNHVCIHSMTYDLDLYDQLIRRVWRQGNEARRVFVHHIIARDTVDDVMFWVLRAKDRTQRALLDALKNIRSTRK